MEFDISKAIEKYGPIFEVTTPESKITVYFRLVSKKEYDVFNGLCDANGITYEAEDYLYNSAIIYPEIKDLDEQIYAGEAGSIVAEMANKSGFFDINVFAEAVSSARRECEKLSEQMVIFIAKAMPGYKIEELEDLNYQELARLLAISEVIMGQNLDLGIGRTKRGNLLDRTEEKTRQQQLTEGAKKALETIRERK